MGNLLSKKKKGRKKDGTSLTVSQKESRRFGAKTAPASDDGMSTDCSTDDETLASNSSFRTDDLEIEDLEEYPDSDGRCYTPDDVAPPRSPGDDIDLPTARSDVHDEEIPSPVLGMTVAVNSPLPSEVSATTAVDVQCMELAGDKSVVAAVATEKAELVDVESVVAAVATEKEVLVDDKSVVAAVATEKEVLVDDKSVVAAVATEKAELVDVESVVAAVATEKEVLVDDKSVVAAVATEKEVLVDDKSVVAAVATEKEELAGDRSVAVATETGDLVDDKSVVAAVATEKEELAGDKSVVAAVATEKEELAGVKSVVSTVATQMGELAGDKSVVAAVATEKDELADVKSEVVAVASEMRKLAGGEPATVVMAARYGEGAGKDHTAARSKKRVRIIARKTEDEAIEELNELGVLGVIAKGGMAFDIESLSCYLAPPEPTFSPILVVAPQKAGKHGASRDKNPLSRHAAFEANAKGRFNGKKNNPETARGSNATNHRKPVTNSTSGARAGTGVTGPTKSGTQSTQWKTGPPPPRKQFGTQSKRTGSGFQPIKQAHRPRETTGSQTMKKANGAPSAKQGTPKRPVKTGQRSPVGKQTPGQRTVKPPQRGQAPKQTQTRGPLYGIPKPVVKAIDRIKLEARDDIPPNNAKTPIVKTKQIQLGKPPDRGNSLVETKGGVAFEGDLTSGPTPASKPPPKGQSCPALARDQGSTQDNDLSDRVPNVDGQAPQPEPENLPKYVSETAHEYAEYIKENEDKSGLQIKRQLEADIEKASRQVESPDEIIEVKPRPLREQTAAQKAESESSRKTRKAELEAQGLTPAEAFAQIPTRGS